VTAKGQAIRYIFIFVSMFRLVLLAIFKQNIFYFR
jgi:hypothetical protein